MAAKKNTTSITRLQKSKTEIKPLTVVELKRLAEKLGVAFSSDTESVQLLILLLQHLWLMREDGPLFWCAIHAVEAELFIVTTEADEARTEFRTDAYKNRAEILSFPHERKVSA